MDALISPGAIAAAIDIGSNSIKMTIGRSDGSGGVEQVDWASEAVRLGEGLDRTGRLDDERMDVALETLKRFGERAKSHGAVTIRAVATEATRAAANGSAFLDRVLRETGIEVWLIDGQEEAALTFRGLSSTTDLTGRVVVADIGGGSTELIVANDGVVLRSRSIPLGSGRLTERRVHADPPMPDELATAKADATMEVGRVARSLQLPAGAEVRLIVVGGTGEFMARLVPNEQQIERKTISQVLAKLAVLTAAELADEIEAPEARARVLPAGIAIVASLAEQVETDQIQVARSGIRVGLLLEALAPLNGDSRESLALPGSAPGAVGPTPSTSGNRSEPADEPRFREAMKALIAQRWEAVWKAVPVALEGTDIEGVHDVRVASRRLRAAMDIATPVFPQRWYRRLHKEAKMITSSLGEVRDRDVLLEALRTDRAAAPLAEHPGIDRLIDHIERERREARTEMETYLQALQVGPLRQEIERRFKSVNDSAGVSEQPEDNGA